jgi:hypothetical protein
METEGSLTRSQEPSISPYLGADNPVRTTPILPNPTSILMLSTYLSFDLPSDLIPSGIPNI